MALSKRDDASPLSSSGYAFIDQEIPFLSMVLKGKMDLYGPYQNFQSDQKVYYLKLIETGVRPSFLLTQEDPLNSNIRIL